MTDRREKEDEEEVISRLERGQPLGFYLRDIHLVSEFICSIYYSSVCVLTGKAVLLNSSGTCPLVQQEKQQVEVITDWSKNNKKETQSYGWIHNL